ncbi:MAG: DUF4340 domain-containing protein [Cyclobacteriaceae bacterium]|nr:DUF4340 domain-containing protein [Cyclobacteriaceae bacterium]
MQKKKNITLLIVLIGLIILTIGVSFYTPSSATDYDKKVFSLSNTNLVDRIEIKSSNEENVFTLSGRQWELNGNFIADLNRINDLFTILEKVNARRRVSGIEKENALKLLSEIGIEVSVYSENEIRIHYKIVENKKQTLTYFLADDGEVFVGNVPGQNYHIATLFKLTGKEWRTNYVFASNWTTLEKMNISYPDEQGFSIIYDPSGYYIENVIELDTSKMYNYLEQVSFLQVVTFLDKQPAKTGKNKLSIKVQDAGDNAINLSFFSNEEGMYYGLIDSLEWAVFRSKDVENLKKKRNWFENKN